MLKASYPQCFDSKQLLTPGYGLGSLGVFIGKDLWTVFGLLDPKFLLVGARPFFK